MKVITIDNPSAAGKGTIGSTLSQRLNCFYLDSGMLYRQMAAWVLDAGVSLTEESDVKNIVAQRLPFFKWTQGYVPFEDLRAPKISDAASKIGMFPEVRRLANQYQRDLVSSSSGWVVVDGRDAGTVVFPDAVVKLFITASPNVRARRRYLQLIEKGYTPDLTQLEEEIIQRDLRDQKRDIAPLKPAPDAYIIDTSEETVDESVHRVLKYLEKYIIA